MILVFVCLSLSVFIDEVYNMKNKNKNKNKIKLKKLYRLAIGLIIFFVTVFGVLPYIIPISIRQIPEYETFRDSNHVLIGQKVVESKYRHEFVSFENIPDFMKVAVVSIEDKRFYGHFGMDLIGLARAMQINIWNMKFVQWGSTITSQLIRNDFRLNSPRTLTRKIAEFYLALVIEKKNSKNNILTDYLNILDFGYMNFGPVSASRFYFGKELKDLTDAEMLALLVLPRNPNKYDHYDHPVDFRTRFELLAQTLKDNKVLTNEKYNQIMSENISWNADHSDLLPYVTNAPIVKWKPGQNYLTVDYYLTKQIQDIANKSIQELQRKNVSDYGVLVVDKNTLDIKVLIWGIDFKDDKNGQYNSVFALNQPWSAVKPLTYALAFEKLGLTPDSTIIDEPVQFQTQFGFAYNPKNFDLDYQWEVSLAIALASSLNIPVIKLADQLGAGSLLDFYHQVWFENLSNNPDQYWLALTLGVWEVSLYQLLRAYTIFGEGGKLCNFNIEQSEITSKGEMIWSTNENKTTSPQLWQFQKSQNTAFLHNNCVQIISSKYTDMVVDILTNRYNKIGAFPINSKLDFADQKVFRKSGTSRKFSDNRVVGFIDGYYIAVRVWNKDGSNMKWVSGASGAGDIFAKIVKLLSKKTISDQDFDIQSTNSDQSQEYFLHIISPMNDSKYSIDDKVPLDSQKIKLHYDTNLVYDSAVWNIYKSWKLNSQIEWNDKFRQLQTWDREFEVELFSGPKLTKKLKNKIFVK